jgi:hypothetical protein
VAPLEKEEKKIKAFRKERRDREEKMGGKASSWFRSTGYRARYFGSAAGGARSGRKDVRGVRNSRSVWYARGTIKCFSCLGTGHVAGDCVGRGFGRGFESSRRQGRK